MPNHLKHPSVRARVNKTATRATLRAVKSPNIPDLPAHVDWSAPVLAWWTRAWSSPMSDEWTASDRDAMFMAASLMQAFWDPEATASAKVRLAAEIRQLLNECGLTPMARRRLQWQIEQGEEASERTSARRSARKKAAPKVAALPDPRERRRGV